MSDNTNRTLVVLPIPEVVNVPKMKQAAAFAISCVCVIRDWLPIENEESLNEPIDQVHWHDLACRHSFEFLKFNPTPGCCASLGPPSAHCAWRELCRGMQQIRNHFGWESVDFREELPPFSLNYPAINAKILARVERSARWISELEDHDILQSSVDEPIELEPDDVLVLRTADAMGARVHTVVSDTVHRKAFPNGEGTMPRNQRDRLSKSLGLIKTKSGGGFMFTAKGILIMDTQLAQK